MSNAEHTPRVFPLSNIAVARKKNKRLNPSHSSRKESPQYS